MKKLLSMLFVAGMATGAFATGAEKSVEIIHSDAAKVTVAMTEAPSSTVIVKILDEENRLVLRDRINKSEAFAKRYDLNALPKGTYSVEVLDNSGVLRTTTFQNFVDEKPSVYSRVSLLEDNKYRLLVSNLSAKAFTVSIYDGDKLIHSEKVADAQGLHKIYNIEKPSASISFRVTTEGGFDKYLSAL
ncbi:hypothetical protein E4S40_14815 [Algoriphagus kandeliae]|uniref:Por secretion system C-terminal sorting domain-containing protein n=1 Tax=Algoriphagus kandeliae TaxID=2562278 RepID=A0A4Y9QR34_9BACT|nr:hypothetical protein [Algoriphagus kandeliae]TFV93516.1 hypothetical protein E4S40_14815 [Algoriphagus kandeliae]